LRPAARAVPPTIVASVRHSAAIARPIPTTGAASGDRPRRLAEFLFDPEGLRAGGRVLVPVLTSTTLTLN
jgi:hypothetical protein